MSHQKQGVIASRRQEQQHSLYSQISNGDSSHSLSPTVHLISSSPSLRHQESFSDFFEAVTELDPTFRSIETDEIQRRTRKRDLLLCHSIFLVTSLVTAIMNAAITIFGMGVGVGLILGDVFRENSRSIPVSLAREAENSTSGPDGETTVVVVRPATPGCRATIRRVSTIATQPSSTEFYSSSSSTLPAQ